ncbi:MAG TPA: SDR family NAD(P)-dependent oxidoreductase [candidate division Zixibacteria bacterium]|nr:SDR family NAD(P)-dependent oxidoreductase [candidate division Zixibacteria bacterium]
MSVAVVAGVGPGLGSSLARAFAAQGYAVALVSRNASSGEPAAREITAAGGRALVVPADVTRPEEVSAAVARIRADLGIPAALAYNAGGYARGPFLELDPAAFRRAFAVGVMGAVYLGQALIPDMLRAGAGFISVTGATAALRGRAGFAPFAIAKSSLRMLAQSWAREFHPKGVHVVHIVVDGQIDTPKLRERDPAPSAGSLIEPEAIAAAVIHALKQPRSAWSHEIDIRPSVEPF